MISTPLDATVEKVRPADKRRGVVFPDCLTPRVGIASAPETPFEPRRGRRGYIAFTISSVIFFASPNSIMVLSR